MIDGKVSVTKKGNIEGEHDFNIKIDSLKKDEQGNITELYLKLTEVQSQFQIKITFSKRGVNFLSRFFLEEFIEQFSKELNEEEQK